LDQVREARLAYRPYQRIADRTFIKPLEDKDVMNILQLAAIIEQEARDA
jgi:hypothetical protein